MALPTIESVTNQMLNESVREQPAVNMKGNVTRPMLVADLLKAMRDVNFSQLISEYGSMAGITNNETMPMTQSLMAEAPKVPASPKDRVDSAEKSAPAPVVDEIAEPIDVPTPMTDAKENVTLSPTGTVVNQNIGLMSNGTQQTT